MVLNSINTTSPSKISIKDFKSALEAYGVRFCTTHDSVAQYWQGCKYLTTNNKLCVDIAVNNMSKEFRLFVYMEDVRCAGQKMPLMTCSNVAELDAIKARLINEIQRAGV